MQERLELKYAVRDAIHGFVRFNEWEKSIINHPWFQRLRRIKQLSLTDFVYPGASHTRFEHSLGVMHVASRMLERICERNSKELIELIGAGSESDYIEIVAREIQLVRFAGLMHDLGHGPFSHASEAVYPINESNGNRYRHEDYSIAAIQDLSGLIDRSQLNNWPEKITVDEVVSLLVKPGKALAGLRKSRLWRLCKQIIDSQLDADKIDYLLRDSYHLGVQYGQLDVERIIDSLTCGVRRLSPEEAYGEDPTTEELHLALDEDDYHVAEGVAIARYWMYEHVYFHKTRRIYDLLLLDALPRLFPEGFPRTSELQNYMKLDDTTVWQELLSSANDIPLKKAVENREHPRKMGKFDYKDYGDIRHALTQAGFMVVSDSDLQQRKSDSPPQVWIDTARTIFYKGNLQEACWLRKEYKDKTLDKCPIRGYNLVELRESSGLVRALMNEKGDFIRIYADDALEAKVLKCLGGFQAR